MARAFPNSTFVGCDFHEPSIEHATTHARQGGGSGNIRFEMPKAKDFPARDIDLKLFPARWLHPSRRIAEPVIGRAFARPVGDAPQDEVL
jgi:hypothetical protein